VTAPARFSGPVTGVVEATPSGDYLQQLFAAGVLIPLGVDGLYARSGGFEAVVDALDRLITRIGRPAWVGADGRSEPEPEVMRLPPAMSRSIFERTGYMSAFPQLAGTVHCFCGDERAHRELLELLESKSDWAAGQTTSELVLIPAACYPIYPIMAERGTLPPGGRVVDIGATCFRHEPSREPTRMQMFRMREYVRMGEVAEVDAFRAGWLERGRSMVTSLRLPFVVEAASDPFFGRTGRLMAAGQIEQALKLELQIPVNSSDAPTACLSFNYHQDKFGATWGLRTSNGAVAHTCCVGFGMERLTLALFRHHGFDTATWPAGVRDILWPEQASP
jgi:seryl-tRNA synthetase